MLALRGLGLWAFRVTGFRVECGFVVLGLWVYMAGGFCCLGFEFGVLGFGFEGLAGFRRSGFGLEV